MSDQQAQWTAAGGGGAPTATMPQPAPAPMAMPEMSDQGKKRKKEKAPKAAKAPKEARARASYSGGDIPLLSFGPGPTREQMEREAADDLMSALTPSYQLLRNEVPDADSPDDAQRRIEARLDRFIPDNDAALPTQHPIYTGDTLVYSQLRRHYGLVQPGNTQGRLGGLLRRSETIHRGMTAADEWGNLHR